jgi:hypothetical protein
MIILNIDNKPLPMLQFSTDDFGTAVHVVLTAFVPSTRELIEVSSDTYWHLFDMEQEIRAEAEV